MRLEQVLFSQGFGTRHECRGLIASGVVSFDGVLTDDPDQEVVPEGKIFCVKGEQWRFFETAIVLLNKPAGYECSTKPLHHPSVMSLLPAPLRARGLQPIGRLDEDTTGVLLLTDDGALIHRLTHPKKHVEKTYRIRLKHASNETLCQSLLKGVKLIDENEVVCSTRCHLIDERTLQMTITSGKYHQVKRMIAAAGNRVEKLHREGFGNVCLPTDLPEGKWMWIEDASVIWTR